MSFFVNSHFVSQISSFKVAYSAHGGRGAFELPYLYTWRLTHVIWVFCFIFFKMLTSSHFTLIRKQGFLHFPSSLTSCSFKKAGKYESLIVKI